MGEERLQKVVARAGLASRRAAERLIADGRVRVNGKTVTELGTRVDPHADRIEVDGRRLVAEKPVYLVLHKPRGVVSTLSDPEGRPSVREFVESMGLRLFAVGPLDFHTSGILLLTNDGEFCDGLLHPRQDVPKTYVVKVAGEMSDADRRIWEGGVELDDGKTRPAKVRLLRHERGKTWLEVTIVEGRNQQIRRMGEQTGFRVMRLARLSFAGICGEGLRPGQLRPLTNDELFQLRAEYGVPRRIPRASAAPQQPIGKVVGRAAPSRSGRSKDDRVAKAKDTHAPREARGGGATAADSRRERPNSARHPGARLGAGAGGDRVGRRGRTSRDEQRPPEPRARLTRGERPRTRRGGG